MAIYEFNDDGFVPLEPTTFGTQEIREREHLQRHLRDNVDIISPDTLVIAEEFSNWQDSRRRIDLLGIDKDARLVVIELKRSQDGGHMELQAARYAAMISSMTYPQVLDSLTSYFEAIGQDDDPEETLLGFLGWEEPDEEAFAQDVRIVLASGEFSHELMTSVMWLNERQLDIRCVRLKPYTDGTRVLLDVQQVVPLPEAADYQIRIAEKQQRERRAVRAGPGHRPKLTAIAEQFLNEKINPTFMEVRSGRLFFLPKEWDEQLPQVGNAWPKLSRTCPLTWWFYYLNRKNQLGFAIEIGRVPNAKWRQVLIHDLRDIGLSIGKLAHRSDARYTRIHTIWKHLDIDPAIATETQLRNEIESAWNEFTIQIPRIKECILDRDWSSASIAE